LRAAPQQRRHLCKPFGARDLPRDNVSLSLNVVKCGTGGAAARDAAMPSPCDQRLTIHSSAVASWLARAEFRRADDRRMDMGRLVADRPYQASA
jgi:hypothetical protein